MQRSPDRRFAAGAIVRRAAATGVVVHLPVAIVLWLIAAPVWTYLLLAPATLLPVVWRPRPDVPAQIQTGAIPTYDIDRDGRILAVNSAMLDLFGVRPDRLTGRHHHELLHLGDAQTCSVCAAVFSNGPTQPIRAQIAGTDGVPFDAEVRVRSVEPDPEGAAATVSLVDVSARLASARQSELAARTDVLTGLPGRSMFERDLTGLLAHEAALGRRVGMIHVDIDGFRSINDTLSHARGDLLLASVADRMRARVPIDALVARIGADEFAVVIPDALADEVMGCADEIRLGIAQPADLDGRTVTITASVGVAFVNAERATPASLMADAGLAVQQAKVSGGDRVVRYDLVLRARADATVAFASELHDAVLHQSFVLEYQPTLRLGERRVDGCEALLRWHHPTRGIVPPATFIPMAERTGAIVPIGRWVIREACRQLAAWWEDPTMPPLQLAVNLSAAQLHDPQLVGLIAGLLDEAPFPAEQLTIELTETVLMEDLDLALPVLGELRRLGVVLSIDDFGSGYSSLSMLRQLPIHEVKIDRQFLQGLATDRLGQRVVASIIDLARALGLTVVAEGIETPDDLRIVEDLGADRAQGYALGRPVRAHVLAASVCEMDEERTIA